MSYLFSGICISVLILILSGFSSAETADVGSKTVPGGNISSSILEADRDTTDWAGFYGTFRQGAALTEEDDDFYTWNMQYSKATILATQSGNEFSGDLNNLDNITSSSDADSISGIPDQGIEKASNTYKDSNLRSPEVSNLGDTVNTNVSYGQSSTFFTNYLYEYDDGTNQHPVYTTDTYRDETAFNGFSPVNYQLLVGTNDGDGQTSTSFDFYIEVE